MTSKPTGEHEPEMDDLTLIKGIKETRQQWLRDNLNVHTFRDLAALSPDEMEALLKADNQIVSRSKIEDWIAQARLLADTTVAKSPKLAKEKGWQPFASFVIEFQEHEDGARVMNRRTRVHHVEADQTKTWTGIEHHELCQWMVSQLGDKVPSLVVEATEAAPAARAEVATPAQAAPSAPDQTRLQKYVARADRMLGATQARATMPSSTPVVEAAATAQTVPPGRDETRLQKYLTRAERMMGVTLSAPPAAEPAHTAPSVPNQRRLQNYLSRAERMIEAAESKAAQNQASPPVQRTTTRVSTRAKKTR